MGNTKIKKEKKTYKKQTIKSYLKTGMDLALNFDIKIKSLPLKL
jgi:hypothetical protein